MNSPELNLSRYGSFVACRDSILEEQRAYANREHREHRSMYGPYICQLPADMLAVITMHRLMGLLMSDQEHGCVKVVLAAVQIGEAVEQEVAFKNLKPQILSLASVKYLVRVLEVISARVSS